MSDKNFIVLRGVRLTKDAEVRTVGQSAVTKISVAQNNGYYEKGTNEWKETAPYFFDIEEWGTKPKQFPAYTKGRKINVLGELVYQTWESDTGRHSKVFIKARQIDIIASPDEYSTDDYSGPGVDSDGYQHYNNGADQYQQPRGYQPQQGYQQPVPQNIELSGPGVQRR